MPVTLHRLWPTADAVVPDAELLDRFTTHRDEGAFTELVRRHGPLVQRICRRLSPAVADDAFQSVFLALACQARAVRAPGTLAGWLVGVAGRIARQMRTAEQLRTHRLHEAGARSVAVEMTDHTEDAELTAALDDELSRLPGRLRDPIVLCLVLGQTHEHAAAELGSSPRTLRRRLERAKTVLRARLARRGIVPAVTAALVAGVGAPVRSVSAELIRLTMSVVSQFPDGRALPRALVAAHGGMTSMVRFKVSVLVATGAAVLLYLGVGWSNEGVPTDPPVPAHPPAGAARERQLVPPSVVNDRPSDPPVAGADVQAGAVGNPFRSANFVVHAPTAMMARVIAAEAEYHRRALALKWLGRELPAWSKPCVIRLSPGLGGNGGASVFEFGKNPTGEPAVTSAAMELRGDFMQVLNSTLPHEVTHTILASHFAKPVPRWVDEGIAVLAESDEEQFNHDVRARELLNAGRGIRLRALLRLTEYPRDMIVLYAEGHSLARFLASRPAPAGVPVLKDVPVVGKLFQTAGADGHRRLIAFVQLGAQDNTAESWAKAAKDVYGFESIDELEEEWIASLRQPPRRVTPKPDRAPTQPKKDTGDNRIPPAQLPTEPLSVPPGP